MVAILNIFLSNKYPVTLIWCYMVAILQRTYIKTDNITIDWSILFEKCEGEGASWVFAM